MVIRFPKLKDWQIGGIVGLGWGIITGFIINLAIKWAFLTPLIKEVGPGAVTPLIIPFLILSFFLSSLFVFVLELPVFFIILPLLILFLLILPDSFVDFYIKEIFLSTHVIGWVLGGMLYGRVVGIIVYVVRSQKKKKKQ